MRTSSLFKQFDMLTLNPGFMRLFKIIALIFLLIHMMSCLWFLLANLSDEETWVDGAGIADSPPEY